MVNAKKVRKRSKEDYGRFRFNFRLMFIINPKLILLYSYLGISTSFLWIEYGMG
jgi:hypothetical protein